MNELVVANVDADMAKSTVHGVEKNQIAWLKFVFLDGFGGIGLFCSAAWQDFSQSPLIDSANKTAAVHTTILFAIAA